MSSESLDRNLFPKRCVTNNHSLPETRCTVGPSARTQVSRVKAHWIAAVTACLVAGLFVSACSSSGESATSTTVSSLSSSTTPSTSTTTTPSLNGHGLLTYDCASGTLSLRDPQSGAVLASETIPFNSTSAPTYIDAKPACGTVPLNYHTILAFRQQFNPTFTLVTALLNQTEPDGSEHVGYVNISTGQFTDVTALTASSGFGSTPPVDSTPIFDENGNFDFLRAQSDGGCVVHQFSLSAHLDTVIGPTNDCGSYWMTEHDGKFALDSLTVSPSGDFAAGDSGAAQGSSVSAGITIEPISGPIVDSAPPDAVNDPSVNSPLTVEGWVNDETLVASSSGSQLYLVRVSATANGNVTYTPILPSNTSTEVNAVVSPSGSQLAFIATQGSANTLYIANLSGSGTPTAVPQGSSDVLIAWQ
jgi:hypothetical protein